LTPISIAKSIMTISNQLLHRWYTKIFTNFTVRVLSLSTKNFTDYFVHWKL